MPSPSDRETPDLRHLTPEPAGDAPAPFLAAVRARGRAVRARRLSVAVVVLAGALAVWRVGLPGGEAGRPIGDGPRVVHGDARGQADRPVHGASLASLRRLYDRPADDGGSVLPELPSLPQQDREEPPLRLRDAARLLADGI